MSTNAATHTACIAADHPCLPGHFPGQPVVPGVLLLDTVIAGVQDQWPDAHIGGVPSAKFLRPALPGQPFNIELQRGDSRITFSCSDADGVLCRGQMTLRGV